jgi:hypothetical protein
VAAIDVLRKRWKDEAHYRPFRPYLHIDDDGLSLGAGTVLAPMVIDRAGTPSLALAGEEEKIIALLSLGYRKPIPIAALKFIKRASMQWTKGEKAIAHFELAYARLPRFEMRDDARALFFADGLVKLGVSPRALMLARGLDTGALDLLKYNPDQPRVPAGQGRQSGEWTSGDGGAAQSPNIASAGSSGEVCRMCHPIPFGRANNMRRTGHVILENLASSPRGTLAAAAAEAAFSAGVGMRYLCKVPRRCRNSCLGARHLVCCAH